MKIHKSYPIFNIKGDVNDYIYSPNHYSVIENNGSDALNNSSNLNTSMLNLHIQNAKKLFDDFKIEREKPFLPICLLLYLSNECNLSCNYCFAGENYDSIERSYANIILNEYIVSKAAQLVAWNCSLHQKPFHFVVSGGGEPTMQWKLLQRIVYTTKGIAEKCKIDWIGHITTNGVIPAKKAEWLGKHFQSITLSCDGPPEIHNRQRPISGSKPSLDFILKSYERFQQYENHFEIRSTITPSSFTRQEEIIEYIIDSFQPGNVRFEPEYSIWLGKEMSSPVQDASTVFVDNFIKAQMYAKAKDVVLAYSGVRLNQIHFTYCNILRDVLNLSIDGKATSCFFTTHSTDKVKSNLLGFYDKTVDKYIIHEKQATNLKQKIFSLADNCNDCYNVYHCARLCPDRCILDTTTVKNGFRCMVNKQLTKKWIELAALDKSVLPMVHLKRIL